MLNQLTFLAINVSERLKPEQQQQPFKEFYVGCFDSSSSTSSGSSSNGGRTGSYDLAALNCATEHDLAALEETYTSSLFQTEPLYQFYDRQLGRTMDCVSTQKYYCVNELESHPTGISCLIKCHRKNPGTLMTCLFLCKVHP